MEPKLCPYCDWELDIDGYCPNENCDHMKNDIDKENIERDTKDCIEIVKLMARSEK